jgi:uncharacterized protein (TIGR02391 family)
LYTKTIAEVIPVAADLLALEVEELAGVLLAYLNTVGSPVVQNRLVSQHNFFGQFDDSFAKLPTDYKAQQDSVVSALLEAWSWLESEVFLVKDHTQPSAPRFFITRRGRRLKTTQDFEAYRKANSLPKRHLHPLIAARVYPSYLRGSYDTAIFEAFREVEVAVRAAGGFSSDNFGKDLMRAAFRPSDKKEATLSAGPGPLTDATLPISEQEAMGHLFVGAIGVYKNPSSHRHVPTNAEDAAEVIVFASQLLRIVDRLKPAATDPVKSPSGF